MPVLMGLGTLCQGLCSTMVLEEDWERAKHQEMSSGNQERRLQPLCE